MDLNKFAIGMNIEHDGVLYRIVDFRKKDLEYLYDLEEIDGDGCMNDVPENRLNEIVTTETKKSIWILTAFGPLVDTVCQVFYTEDDIFNFLREEWNKWNMSVETIVDNRVWKTEDSVHQNVEWEIHRKEIDI